MRQQRIGDDSLIWRFLESSPDEWIQFAVGLLALVIVIWLTFRLRAWLRDDSDPTAMEQQMLTQISVLHRQGDLTEMEYRSIKSQLIEKLDGSTYGPEVEIHGEQVLIDVHRPEAAETVCSRESAPATPHSADQSQTTG